MVLTCRPRSGATPAGSARSTTRHLDAETNWAGMEPVSACPSDGVAEGTLGAAATISTQHGATVFAACATGATAGLGSGLGAAG